MADGITLNSGSGGDTLAADDVAGTKYPIQKVAYGALDSVTLAASGAGAVSAGVQRVTLASDDPAVTDLAAIEVLLGTIDSDTSALAGAVSGTEMQVDVVTSALPTGASTAAKQPALGTAGTASADVITVQGIAAMTPLIVDLSTNNDVTVTGTVDLGATDNAVLDAIAASVAAIDTDATTIIGHVDGIEALLTTIDSDTGTLAVVGGGLEATALRVTIASDSTGVVSIDDNGGAITVDGTVAVTNAGLTELAAAINASSQMDVNIAASNASVAVTNAGITTIAGAVSGTEMQVDVVAALPAGTNAIGKLAANSGVDIGDVDVTSIAAGTNNIGNVGIIPRTSGGMTIFRSIDIDESEEEVKATAGQLFSISAFNTTAAPLYLKFYNATAANVTVGTTTPVLTFAVPGNADSDGAGFVWNNEIGFAFGTAISVACTTGVADNDTGAPGANACIINLGYA